MTFWEILGRTLSALVMGVIFGLITWLVLNHFIPNDFPFSAIAPLGAIGAAAFGAFLGWKWADSVLGEALSQGIIEAIFRGLASVFKGL